ncbi:MAG: LysM peptidoglycan-binding domain-containing protein [Candidatus Pacebacteria bacterium]|nr:LysM peptidoglycan-binding domain-containing protein [Candidatus Paceibacterota bacterium]
MRFFNEFLINPLKKHKGFSKDPFFYLAISAFVLLVFVSFCPRFRDRNAIPLSSGSSRVAGSSSDSSSLFLGQASSQTESPDFYLVQKNSLMGIAPPVMVTPQVLGAILGENDLNVRKEVTEYEVKEGDTLSTIAENFGISLKTLLWANNLSSTSKIKAGQTLVILPVSGVIHHVISGDTVSAIALKYKAKASDIVSFNELASEDDIFIGDILIIPDGVMPVVKSSYIAQIPIASSYFICPIASPCRITQKLHWYNGVDFSHSKCGDSIYAAAGGTVQKVKFGWNGGGGNTITILHPNGVITSYGHIQTALVKAGDQVYQGQIIALMGGLPGTSGAGISTGCHLHFAVIGGRNPFGY